MNDTKLYKSKVPFVLDSWLNETNMFTNRACELLFMSKEEQNAYVVRTHEDGQETVKPFILKSHIIRYGSKAKQSIMNQLNEMICSYESKDRTIVAYFLSTLLNNVDKNKENATIFKKDVSEATVFSFMDLVFYAYSFFPNYNNTQKLLAIISYVRDEYDIFSKKQSLQRLINKYSFIFEKANLNDVVDLFLFCAQAKIEIPYTEEKIIVEKMDEKDDPIIWGTYLLYSRYNKKYFDELLVTVEKKIVEHIDAMIVNKSILEYREFWWVIVFNKCPYISAPTQTRIDLAISSLPYVGTGERNASDIAEDLFVDYLKNNVAQFFDWNLEAKDFLRTITFKTHEKSIFKNYKENAISLAWGSF